MQADTTSVARYNLCSNSTKLRMQKIGFWLVKNWILDTTPSGIQMQLTAEAKNSGFA